VEALILKMWRLHNQGAFVSAPKAESRSLEDSLRGFDYCCTMQAIWPLRVHEERTEYSEWGDVDVCSSFCCSSKRRLNEYVTVAVCIGYERTLSLVR
jgi:hypothetical protein